jgi:hypothetical protein
MVSPLNFVVLIFQSATLNPFLFFRITICGCFEVPFSFQGLGDYEHQKQEKEWGYIIALLYACSIFDESIFLSFSSLACISHFAYMRLMTSITWDGMPHFAGTWNRRSRFTVVPYLTVGLYYSRLMKSKYFLISGGGGVQGWRVL